MKKNNTKTKKQTNSETNLKFYFSLSFACFLCGTVLTFVPDFFISEKITFGVRWVIFFTGVVLLALQSAKLTGIKNSSSPLFFGLAAIGFCVLFLVFDGEVLLRIISFAFLYTGLFGICYGFPVLIGTLALAQNEKQEQTDKNKSKSDTIKTVGEILAVILVILQILLIILQYAN